MKKNTNKTPNNNPDLDPRQVNSFDNLYSEDIVKAFAEKMEKKNSSFLSVSSKEKMIQEFEKFVQEEYDDNILQALKDGKIAGKSIDVELNNIVDKGFTLDDILKPASASVIKNKFGNMTSEPEAISHGLVQCHKQRKNLTADTKDTLKFADFLREIGYKGNEDEEGNLLSVSPNGKGVGKSLSSIVVTWKDFVRSRIHSTEDISLYTDMLSLDHFDPTEKIACISAVRNLYHNIDRLGQSSGTKKDTLTDIWTNIFGTDALYNPVDANTSWISIENLARDMENFFREVVNSGLVSQKDIDALKNINITTKSCAFVGEQSGDMPKGVYEEQIKNQKFSSLSKQMQEMVNSFAQIDLVNNVVDVIDTLDTDLASYAKIFDMPGNMGEFLKQFGVPMDGDVDRNSYEYKLHEKEYKQKNREYVEFCTRHKNEFATNRQLQDQKTNKELELETLKAELNPHGAYLALQQKKESIQNKLSDNLSLSQKKALLQELSAVDLQITKTQSNSQQTLTRDSYFNHVANQVDESIAVIGSGVIYGEQVVSVLKKLKDSNRNISTLSLDDQNVLMQASVSIQLMKVKEDKSTDTIGYGFQEYAAFVTGLYDLRLPSQSIIMTKDNNPITLNFTSKKFVGKGNERHTVDITDISSLSNIRVEFELDLDDNPDAEEFVRIMTGGDKSQLIEDFLPGAKNPKFPKTITDSSLVKMVDKHGVTHEGYLSRYEFPDNDEGNDRPSGSSPLVENGTYILYDRPADQLHMDRKVVTRGATPAGQKAKPVYINMDNLNDRQSVDIEQKRVTLSDQHLKALTLGHMVAQKTTKEEFLYPKNPATVQEMITASDQKLSEKLGKATRDLDTNMIEEESSVESQSESALFAAQRNKLFKSKDAMKSCVKGARFALELSSYAVKSVPEGTPLLSAIVKEVIQDTEGNITGCVFSFESLSRTGTCNMKDVTFSGGKLSVLSEAFKSVTYLDNTETDPQDYAVTLQRLSEIYKDNKSYNFAMFSDLTHDGTMFRKGKHEVLKFLAKEKTEDADSNDTTQYSIEYTVKKLGDKYEITSSPYCVTTTEGTGEKKKTKKENQIFSTKTDMAGMLLVLAGKKLLSQTADDEKKQKDTNNKNTDTIPTRSSRRRSLSSVRSVVKSGGKSLLDGLKKKRGADQEDEIKQILFNEMNVYRKLSDGPLGKLLGVFDLDVFDDLADEAEASGMEYGWKKINAYYEQLEKFHPAWNTGVRNAGLGIAQDLMKGAVKSYEKTETCSYKDRLKTGASLMYMLEKMKNGYSKGFAEYPRGQYVKIMLGPKAYSLYEERYRQLELESRDNSPTGYKKREQLLLLEYNYIVDSIRGGPNTDNNNVRTQHIDPYRPENNGENPFYFQHLYSRKFANELSKKVGAIKTIPTSGEKVDELAASNNFEHVYGECKAHIGELRVADAVTELAAVQKMANTKAQGDRVAMLIMAGILNGAFVHNLSKDTKGDLKVILRNSSFPYPQVIENYDAPQKIQAILQMATANKGENAFAKFRYGPKDKPKERNYESTDFNTTDGKNSKKIEGFVHHFESRRDDNQGQIVPFLHMDASSLKTDDNLIKIWKSNDPELKIFGAKVDPFAKGCVDAMMGELYTNRSRGANLDNYNFNTELSHTATTIENFYRDSINKCKGQDREPAVGDHAATIWGAIKDNAPTGLEPSSRKDMLSHHVSEFFRVFQGFGLIDNESNQIGLFYRNIRLAQDPSFSAKDKKRLVWFDMTKRLFNSGPVPEVVSDAFVSYMTYFESNLANFDQELGKLHPAPGDHSKNFESSFVEPLDDVLYIPESQWNTYTLREKNNLVSEYENNKEITILNQPMTQANKEFKGTARNSYSSNRLGITVDKKIAQLTGMTVGATTAGDLVRTLQIDTTNKDQIDLSSIQKPAMTVIKGGLHPDKTKSASESLTDEELEEELGHRGLGLMSA